MIIKTKNAFDVLISRLKTGEERTSEHEYKSIEISHSETQRPKRKKNAE